MFRQNTKYHDIFHEKYFVERTLGFNAVKLFIDTNKCSTTRPIPHMVAEFNSLSYFEWQEQIFSWTQAADKLNFKL
jgi:hypothetical protein